MEQGKQQLLCAAGIDVEEALGRFMGNEALLLKFLLRFPGDDTFSRLRQAMEARDTTRAFEAAHTLKGVVGNLSMKELHGRLVPLVVALRAGDADAAAENWPALEAAYGKTLAALERIT